MKQEKLVQKPAIFLNQKKLQDHEQIHANQRLEYYSQPLEA